MRLARIERTTLRYRTTTRMNGQVGISRSTTELQPLGRVSAPSAWICMSQVCSMTQSREVLAGLGPPRGTSTLKGDCFLS